MRQHVKKQLIYCMTCLKLGETALEAPDTAPLPQMRVQEAPPFAVTDV